MDNIRSSKVAFGGMNVGIDQGSDSRIRISAVETKSKIDGTWSGKVIHPDALVVKFVHVKGILRNGYLSTVEVAETNEIDRPGIRRIA